jgi:hypothetical protein
VARFSRRGSCAACVTAQRGTACQLLLTVIVGSARRRVGDAVSQLLLSVAPHSFVSLGLSHGPMKFSVFLHQRSAMLIEINASHRN